ncbi:MAG: cation-efflux pump, partial [Chloroflexota bacterium]|nr:cation-efflux pump [Chloroflexota bacterium]
LSLIADGFDSVFDSASNVIGLVGIYFAAQPADATHPYGHRKAETIAAASIAVLLFATCANLAQSAWQRLTAATPVIPEVNAWSFGALLCSILVHAIVVSYEYRAGKRLRSDVLIADAKHTRADIFISVSVMVGLILVRFGLYRLDALMTMGIAVLIARIGIDIVRESSQTLLDGAAVPVSAVEKIALAVPGVQMAHHIRSRGYQDEVFVDLHIKVDPSMTTSQAHALAHEVQHRLISEMSGVRDVVVHVEPAHGHTVSEEETLVVALRSLAEGMGLTIHDVWVTEMAGRYHVELHLEVPPQLSLEEAHSLASQLEERAQRELTKVAEVTTHIEPMGGQPSGEQLAAFEEQTVTGEVERIVHEMCGAGACHQVVTRREGETLFVSAHCNLRGETSIRQAHAITEEIERRLRNAVPRLGRVVIHVEPMGNNR